MEGRGLWEGEACDSVHTHTRWYSGYGKEGRKGGREG